MQTPSPAIAKMIYARDRLIAAHGLEAVEKAEILSTCTVHPPKYWLRDFPTLEQLDSWIATYKNAHIH